MSNHTKEALQHLDVEFGSFENQLGWETADAQHIVAMLAALTQANLAIAAQQRIANLIAATEKWGPLFGWPDAVSRAFEEQS